MAPAALSSYLQNREERTLCTKCLKSSVTCYCEMIRPFKTHVLFVILQHPSERRRAIGTARMTHLCIENSKLISGKDFDKNREVNEIIQNPLYQCVVLYPGPKSFNMSGEGDVADHPLKSASKKLVIFVIDGTWHFAKKMLNRSNNLLALPHVCFTPDVQSEYKIRQQPHQFCVSTIEAVHKVIQLIEPTSRAEHLLEIFRSMVNQQINFYEQSRMKNKDKV